MDFDLLKQYKEYEDLQAKLAPLRTEYSFLIEDIEKKRKEYEVVLKSISSVKDSVTKGSEQLERDRKDFDARIQSERKQLEDEWLRNKLSKQSDLDKFDKQLDKIEEDILIGNDTINRLDKETSDKTKQLESLKIEVLEYSWVLEKQNKENQEIIEKLKNEKQLLNDRQKEMNEKEMLFKKHEEIYNKYKSENNIESEKLSKMASELNEKSLEIDKNYQILIDKEATEKEAYLSAKKEKLLTEEKIQELRSKEQEIAKTITEFQEEKYRFLVIMKQREIKKTDLDKLDKDFNL